MAFLRRGLIGWLLLALLWAPSLGLLHRHVHVHAAPHAAEAAHHAGHAQAPGGAPGQPAAALHGWIASLFAGHGQAADCLLYDQCNVGDALVGAPLALPAAPPFFVLQRAAGEALARWAALYDARGPPPVR
jgi:hypothetical protein